MIPVAGSASDPVTDVPIPDPRRHRVPASPTQLQLWPIPAPVDWFLTAEERGNPDTRLDSRHPGATAWTTGNDVRPLVHGAQYFRVLCQAVSAMGRGDLIMFTDWRGDPDEQLDGPGTELAAVLAAAAERGVEVRGLLWRSHLDAGPRDSGEPPLR